MWGDMDYWSRKDMMSSILIQDFAGTGGSGMTYQLREGIAGGDPGIHENYMHLIDEIWQKYGPYWPRRVVLKPGCSDEVVRYNAKGEVVSSDPDPPRRDTSDSDDEY